MTSSRSWLHRLLNREAEPVASIVPVEDAQDDSTAWSPSGPPSAAMDANGGPPEPLLSNASSAEPQASSEEARSQLAEPAPASQAPVHNEASAPLQSTLVAGDSYPTPPPEPSLRTEPLATIPFVPVVEPAELDAESVEPIESIPSPPRRPSRPLSFHELSQQPEPHPALLRQHADIPQPEPQSAALAQELPAPAFEARSVAIPDSQPQPRLASQPLSAEAPGAVSLFDPGDELYPEPQAPGRWDPIPPLRPSESRWRDSGSFRAAAAANRESAEAPWNWSAEAPDSASSPWPSARLPEPESEDSEPMLTRQWGLLSRFQQARGLALKPQRLDPEDETSAPQEPPAPTDRQRKG